MDLAIFELDHTLICDDSHNLWLHWLISQGYASREELSHYRLHAVHQHNAPASGVFCPHYAARYSQYLSQTLLPMSGMSCATVANWVQRFIHRDILPRVYPQAREKLEWHRARGDEILIVSDSGEHLVIPVARRLGADAGLGLQTGILNQRFSGTVEGELTFHQGRVDRLKVWLDARRPQTYQQIFAYSHTLYDQPLLEFADVATVINASEPLQKIAAAQGWNSQHWSRYPRLQKTAC
ncbi:HAD family hydrolase [Rahnella victoriana]|uniref:HAD family hydrolase n=1 Tax=Rahnella victoriana TaxID=1510570 RepID=UPI001E2B6D2B|nr:HAD-IB family hydrolase [Rahnella victoriana]UHM90015.1 HAD-IB family hydrolase [Rahnella victoriana]